MRIDSVAAGTTKLRVVGAELAAKRTPCVLPTRFACAQRDREVEPPERLVRIGVELHTLAVPPLRGPARVCINTILRTLLCSVRLTAGGTVGHAIGDAAGYTVCRGVIAVRNHSSRTFAVP